MINCLITSQCVYAMMTMMTMLLIRPVISLSRPDVMLVVQSDKLSQCMLFMHLQKSSLALICLVYSSASVSSSLRDVLFLLFLHPL